MSQALGITTDRQTPQLDAMHRAAKNPRALMAAVGKRGEMALRGWFAMREAEPNRSGWTKRHFWARRIRANTVLTEVTSGSATIDIAAPEFRQKLYGGTIRPREGKFLAIPARQEAYGKSPRSFGNLRFVSTKKGGGILVADEGLQGPLQRGVKRARGTGAAYYFLVRSVTQAPDARALPPRYDFENALIEAAQEFLAREAQASA